MEEKEAMIVKLEFHQFYIFYQRVRWNKLPTRTFAS